MKYYSKKDLKKYLLISLAAPILALAGESGTAIKTDVLRAEPFADAKLRAI